MLFVEFKAPDKHPTKLQIKVISRIETHGFSVYIIDNVEEGKKLADNFVK